MCTQLLMIQWPVWIFGYKALVFRWPSPQIHHDCWKGAKATVDRCHFLIPTFKFTIHLHCLILRKWVYDLMTSGWTSKLLIQLSHFVASLHLVCKESDILGRAKKNFASPVTWLTSPNVPMFTLKAFHLEQDNGSLKQPRPSHNNSDAMRGRFIFSDLFFGGEALEKEWRHLMW